MSDESCLHNQNVLESFGYDLKRVIDDNTGSTISFGSEFRPADQLRPLLSRHPLFDAMEKFIYHGMPYIFSRELPAEESLMELTASIARGNHKSANDELEQVKRLISKDVTHGFSVPFPASTVTLLPSPVVTPLGLAKQWTLDNKGERVPKFRMTQDLSFSSSDPTHAISINKRIDMGSYPEMIYGWCFSRTLHFIASLRYHHPLRRILIAKYDFSDAYRRIAHSAQAAHQTISIVDNRAHMALRLTFGGSPNPPTWCAVAEVVTDLANEINHCPQWDHSTVHSPVQTVSPAKFLPDHVPISPAFEMSACPYPVEAGKVDDFIDDLIHVFPESVTNLVRAQHIVPLAIHITFRPHAGTDEPVPRRALLSPDKLAAEGVPAEVQTVLGWSINCRTLKVHLPADKYETWTTDLRLVLDKKRIQPKELESLVGRLNHTASIIPLTRHFLSRIRKLTSQNIPGFRHVNITGKVLTDLQLWLFFLQIARDGISINLLVSRSPTRVGWSDSCPFGIGGTDARGRAWRIRIVGILAGNMRFNNLFEFIGMAVTIKLLLRDLDDDDPFRCILAVGDSTSAIGWIFNTSHLSVDEPCHEAHHMVAHEIARDTMSHDACLAGQHLKGLSNVVPDLLSYDGTRDGKRHPLAYDHPSDAILTQRFHSHLPSQIPESFTISPLPDEISSWVCRVLQVAASSLTASKKPHLKTSTGAGDGGRASLPEPDIEPTPSSLPYPQPTQSSSPEHFSPAFGISSGVPTERLDSLMRRQYLAALSAKPQAM